MDKKYEHILYLPHPVSPNRPRLSAAQRAAQFAPFAALTGFEAVIRETARQTQHRICLDEGEVAAISRCLGQVKQRIAQKPQICVKFFVPDDKKAGGEYSTIRSRVIKIDEKLQNMRLETGEIVAFENILQIFLVEKPTGSGGNHDFCG